MSLTIKAVTEETLGDLGQLFAVEAVATACWCMWFIIPVKAFHAAGQEGNAAAFQALAASSGTPLGLLAYQGDRPVGWCAVGPRARYARALKTPTYRGAVQERDADVWLVPCFFIHPEARRLGVAQALLEAAVGLATEHGASAIDGFPFAGAQSRSGGDTQVGFEGLFSSCGFEVVVRPSASRVVMRRTLKA